MSPTAWRILEDPKNQLVVSVASLWEIVIKSALKKANFSVDAMTVRTQLVKAGYMELPVTADHALAVTKLELVHGDPFDRLLVAQANFEDIQFLTADRKLARYSGKIILS